VTARPLKKAHLLRCAQTARSNVLIKYASAREFFARLAFGTFLIGLKESFQKLTGGNHAQIS
jgi:hypothetical protein